MKSTHSTRGRAGLHWLGAACLACALSGCPAQSPEGSGTAGKGAEKPANQKGSPGALPSTTAGRGRAEQGATAGRGTIPESGATAERGSIAERAACSTLCQAKQPAEKALPEIAALGFRWVDLSCLSWAPHASVEGLVSDFEKEAARLESLLAANNLGVANLTFDAVEIRPFERYRKEFEAVVKLAVRLKTRLINLMAPSLTSDWKDQVEKLRALQEIAARSGVTLTVETHTNQVTERPEAAVKLCKEVPGLGLTLDPSHYYAGPHQGGSFDELYPLARGTGLRAGGMSWEKVQLPWGEGPIDFAAVVRKLEAAGYKGFYVAEYIEGFNQVDALAESRKFLAWIRKSF